MQDQKSNGQYQPPVVRAESTDEAMRLMQPGVIVEMDRATAEALGAMQEDCIDEEEALAAMLDPATFADDWREQP